MRTLLLAAAITTALVIPIVTYRPLPAPLATAEPAEVDPVFDMVARGCMPTVQEIEPDVTLVRLCPQQGNWIEPQWPLHVY